VENFHWKCTGMDQVFPPQMLSARCLQLSAVDPHSASATGLLPQHIVSAVRPCQLLVHWWHTSAAATSAPRSHTVVESLNLADSRSSSVVVSFFSCCLMPSQINCVLSTFILGQLLLILERGANDLHMVQLMPLPPRHLLLKIQNGLPFWCRLTQVVLEKRAPCRLLGHK